MGSNGLIWIPLAIGIVAFFLIALFATSRNKRDRGDVARTEAATNELYERVDREDKARDDRDYGR